MELRPTRTLPVLDSLLTAAKNVDRTSGNLRPADVASLQSAAGAFDANENPIGSAAANQVVNRVQYSGRIDAFDTQPLLDAAKALKAGASGAGPKLSELAAALKASAVPAVNVKPSALTLDLDLSALQDPKVTEFPAVSRLTLGAKAPAKTLLAVNPDRLTVQSVQADGKDVPFKVELGRLIVDVVDAPGATSLDIHHTIKPQFIQADGDAASATGLIVDRRDPSKTEVMSLLWPYNTDQLFPSNPDPSAALTAKVNVKGPADPAFVSQGTDEASLIPPYDVDVRVSNNLRQISGPKTQNGTQLNFWANKANPLRTDAEVQSALVDVKAGLEEVERILQAPYRDRVINFEETAGGLGGMEHQGMPAIYDGAIADTSKKTNMLIDDPLHEAIHGYFGNGVLIKDWPNFSVSEGFVEYLMYRGLLAAKGRDYFNTEMENSKNTLSRALARSPQPLVTPAGGDINQYFNQIPYELGAQIHRMVESQLGTERFDGLLAQFYAQQKGKPTSLAQWSQFLTDKTGTDFNAFYKTWGDIGGVPRYLVATSTQGNSVSVDFAGVGARLPRGTTVPMVLEGANGESKTVAVNPEAGSYQDGGRMQTFDAGFPVTRVTMDPDKTVLAAFSGT